MENNEVIKIEHLTKDYGDGKGIFDINLTIKKGEMVGFVGTNGSGKTTTIRSIMGFIKPTKGQVLVNDKNTWEHYDEIVKNIGYVPGEIAFPDLKTGIDFLKSQAEFLSLRDLSYADELIEKLQLDPRANLKRMSKGMKQKTALVEALMDNADIIILDEPTTGLDPLMRDAFLDIIKSEHKKGKTIFMSSHIFEELEQTCDRVAFISEGKIIDVADMNEIRNRDVIDIKIEFDNERDYEKFLKDKFKIIRKQKEFSQVTVQVKKEKLDDLFKSLSKLNVKFFKSEKYTLEKHFKLIMKNKEEK